MALIIIRIICGLVGALFAMILLSSLFDKVTSYFDGFERDRNLVLIIPLTLAMMFTAWKAGNLELDSWVSALDRTLEFYREHKYWLIGCGAASVLGLVLMGAPGGLVLVMDYIVEPLIAKPNAWLRPHGDTTWPFMIGCAMILPWFIFGFHFILKKLWLAATTTQTAVTIIVASLILFFVVQVVYRFANRGM